MRPPWYVQVVHYQFAALLVFLGACLLYTGFAHGQPAGTRIAFFLVAPLCLWIGWHSLVHEVAPDGFIRVRLLDRFGQIIVGLVFVAMAFMFTMFAIEFPGLQAKLMFPPMAVFFFLAGVCFILIGSTRHTDPPTRDGGKAKSRQSGDEQTPTLK